MSAENRILDLLADAARSDKPERLDSIAAALDKEGQWDHATLVRAKARIIEHKQAESAFRSKVWVK